MDKSSVEGHMSQHSHGEYVRNPEAQHPLCRVTWGRRLGDVFWDGGGWSSGN